MPIAASVAVVETRINWATPGADVAMAQAKELRPSEITKQQATSEIALVTHASLTQPDEGGPFGAVKKQSIVAKSPRPMLP